MLNIDGSYGEGGGQILRTSLSLSSLLKEPVKITNIRANRPKPGLAQQHMTGIKALKDITGAEVKGLKVGSTEIEFHPEGLKSGQYQVDIGTAGSITLILQVLLIPCAFASGKIELTITGGTDVIWSPPIDYVKRIFLLVAEKMGYDANIELISRGYYPKGNGKIKVEISPVKSFSPINLTERGDLIAVKGIAHSLNLPCHIVERLGKSAKEALTEYGCDISLECKKNFSTGCGLTLWAEFEKTVLGASAVGELGKPAEKVGREAGSALRDEIRGGAALDKHMCDQIIPYMALADGTSEIMVHELTSHLKTNIYITEKILGNKFSIQELGGRYVVKTNGIGFKNASF